MANIGVKVELEGAPQYVENMKNLQQQTKLFGEQLKRVQNEMQGKNAFSKSIAETNALKQQQEALTNQATLLSQRIKEASDKYGENSTQVLRLKTQYEQLQSKLISVDRELKEHGGLLGAVGAQLTEVGAKTKAVGDKIAGFGTKLTTSVTVPLVAMGAKAATSFAEVDKTMQLTNKTMGNTEKEAKLIDDAMKKAADSSIYGMTDAATATLNFARAGLTAEQSASALAPAMNLAAGEGGELDTVSAGLVATINGFHGSFDDAAKYADIFANACNNSALDINSMAESMSIAAPIFASAGYTLQDAALYMGTMANSGIEASVAANSLKTGLAKLVSPAKEGATWLDRLGLSVTNADGSMKDSVTVQKELHNAFSQLSESEQIAAASAIFGENQMANWLALINTAPEDVAKLNEQLEAEGTTMEMATAMMSGFGGSLEQLKSSADVAMTSLGEALAPSILKVADAIQSWVDKFNALTPEQQQHIAQIGMMVAALGPLVLILGKTIVLLGNTITAVGTISTALGTTLIPAVQAIGAFITTSLIPAITGAVSFITTTAIPAIGAVVVAIGPFLAIAAAVVAAIVGIVEIVQHWGEITQWFSETWSNITDSINAEWANFKASFVATGNIISNAWTNLWNGVGNKVKTAWSNIKTSVTNGITNVKTSIDNMKTAIKEKFDGIKNSALQWGKDMIQNFIDGIKSKVQAVKDAVTGVADTIKSYLHFSEPDVGPMKNFNDWPRDMMHQYAEGISAGAYLVRQAVDGVATEVEVLQNPLGIDADELYDAVQSGASNANISIGIGEREFTRTLGDMGVVFR